VAMPEPVPAWRARSYRRRRPLPAISLMIFLGMVAAIVWIRALDTAQQRTDLACTPPHAAVASQPPPVGATLAATALDDIEPLPPDAVKVRVLNANGQRGQAALAASVLIADLGFGMAAEPTNDTLYPAFDLDCHAQIRFGVNGVAAGRTLSIVLPCAELVRDARDDATVDLALGRQFDALRPSPDAKDVLRQLTELAAQPADPTGGQQGVHATVDPTLLATVRSATRC
jgi:hypothetical protein